MQRLGRLPSLGVTRYSLARWVGVSATRRAVLEIKDKEQFQKQVLDSPDPVLVDFHATWCPPCRSLGPLLEEVSSRRQLLLAKVDIDILPGIALDYEVDVVPAVIAVRGGEVVGQFVGLQNSQFLEQFASELLQESATE